MRTWPSPASTRRPGLACLLAGLSVAAAALPSPCLAGFNQLTFISGSTRKVEQVNGDHDWADTTLATHSLTLTRADVLGNDIGTSFVDGDSLIFLFGDTIGASQQYVPTWADSLNPYKWNARDPIASSTSTSGDSGLVLDFFRNSAGDSTLIVAPVYPNGSALAMGIDDVPNAGIALGNKLYLVCKTGAVSIGGVTSNDSDSAVVVRFHPVLKTFTAGRTLSRLADGGHFLTTSLHELPPQFASSPTDSEVLIFGVGRYRRSDVYLSMIPRGDFASGTDAHGVSDTRYFTGLINGQPVWSGLEPQSEPIVQDDPYADLGIGEVQQPWPLDDPTIGNLSVAWVPALGLWIMTYDGGRQSPGYQQTKGIYFTYAQAPWGPWIKPQLVFNATRDGGFGTFMRHWDTATQTGTGPAGPTIGVQSSNDPDSTNGGVYAPGLIEPFTRIAGDTLKIYYTMSTWNPYAIVLMRSEFIIAPGALSVDGPGPRVPGLRAWPDPSRSLTHVSFALPHAGSADVGIYDLAGRLIRGLYRGPAAAGTHEVEWDGRSDSGATLHPGVYFVRVRSGDISLTRRVTRL